MAKKRKLRSEPEPAKTIEEESTQPEEQPHNMAVDEENSEPQPLAEQGQDQEQIDQQEPEDQAQVEGEQEGEEEEDPDEEQEPNVQPVPPQSDPVQTEANGGEGQNENNGSGVPGDDDDLEDEPLEKLLEPFSKDQMVTLVKKSIEKYPDLIEAARALADADPAHRKIFVHGLGWDTTAETLTSVFGEFGEIEDCKHVTDRVSGKSKGYAFILFKHRSGARMALKEPQKKIGNRTTSCQLATTGPVPAPPPTGATAPVVVSELTQRKIFVSNVSAEIDPQKLLEFFKQFGEIEEGPLGLDKQTGKPKGFALFVYKSIDSAKRALEEPHKSFEGVTLHCQKAIDGPKPGKPYGSGGGGGGGGHHHQQGHHYHQQPHYHHRKDKNKYGGGGGGGGGAAASGHLMAPAGPGMGFNPGAAGAGAPGLNPALGQALTALLATQGAGLGIGNLLGGMGPGGMNQGGVPGGYGNQSAGGYAMQPGLQGAYQNPQMGQGSAGRPPQGGGAPYMGH